jgi:chromosome segregation ATPase
VEETTRWEQANTDLKLKLRNSEEALSSVNGELEKLRLQHSQLADEYKKANQHLVEY